MASASPIPTPDPNSAAWSLYLQSQKFNLTGLTGRPVTLSLSDIDNYIFENIKQTVTWAFSLGFASMLFLIIIPLTQGKQRRQPIYILNLISLFVIAFRSILAIKTLIGSYFGIGAFFLGAYGNFPNTTWAPRCMSCILSMVLFGSIVTSLVLQVRVVFAATPKTQRLVTWIFGILALIFECIEIAWQSLNSHPRSCSMNYHYPSICIYLRLRESISSSFWGFP